MYDFGMKCGMYLRPIVVFLATSVVCAVFMPWHGFADPDGFYHAKISSLIWLNGPVQAFPWLDLTALGQKFADLHFLFHLFSAPFTAAFGMFLGLRIAVVILAGIFFTVFDFCLRKLKVPYAWAWIALLLFTQPFLFRILLAKATPMALTLFVAGLTAAWLRKPIWVFALTALFALSHGGWLYLAGSIILLAFGRALYSLIVEDEKFRKAIRESMWREIGAGFIGGISGMLVHPNFPQNFILSWTQVFVIGLGTPFEHVMLGLEWHPAGIKALFTSYAPWIVAGGLGMAGLALAPRQPLDKEKAKMTASVGWIVAVLLALTLKSRRNTEYLAPTVALWTALLWSHVDMKKLFQGFSESLRKYGKTNYRIVVAVIAVLGVGLLARESIGAWDSLHSGDYPDEKFVPAMVEISKKAVSGDRVFHTSWDEFPMLFAADDRLRYVAGLDPTFLYVASSTLSDDVKNLTWGMTSTTKEQAWGLIHDRLDSKFIFVGKAGHEQFLELMNSDEKYVNIADFPDSAAFEVKGE